MMAENARRRKRGEDPLPLPTVPSRKKLRQERDASRKPPKPEARDSDSEGEERESLRPSLRDIPTDGLVLGVLGYDPLPILAGKSGNRKTSSTGHHKQNRMKSSPWKP